ncbi:hypothetical protein S40285_00845 [Stachybotrys chlorohalonatus IBT 40285]|uniref:Uncharacterized protein n=1 Tax=Stachybotrys chlorohalonatus (strain IBT 40285) TaxID=1283841 RepID=A0A084QJM8_STAC4|nr:hypothetical protein S40285_00845 [Stachybotrys chlorohalonata IBT 40285]
MIRNRMLSRTPRPRRNSKSLVFELKLRQMQMRVSPLVRLDTGTVHPDFPTTMLHFWLLTEHQLDSLAYYYHQAAPNPFWAMYPYPICWDFSMCIETKRMEMAKFIGLRVSCPYILKTEDEIAEDARMARIAEDERSRKGFPSY